MKRGGPLKRTKPLQRGEFMLGDPEAIGAWQERSRETARERARQKKPRRRRSRREEVVPRDWTRRVFEMHGGQCLITGQRAVQAHHVIPVHVLIAHGFAGRAGDPRNGIPLCKRAHERHETATERILRSCLPVSVFEFADELGLGWYIDDERIYPRLPPAHRGVSR